MIYFLGALQKSPTAIRENLCQNNGKKEKILLST